MVNFKYCGKFSHCSVFVYFSGNTLLVLAVCLVQTMRDVTNLFVVNLSVCDLLFVTAVLPFNIYTYITQDWSLDDWLCQAIGFLGYALTGAYLTYFFYLS